MSSHRWSVRGAVMLLVLLSAAAGLPAQNTITANPSALSFAYQTGGSQPQPQTVYVDGTAGLSVSAVTTTGANWLFAGPSPQATPYTLIVQVVPTNLAQGTHTGTITLSATGASPVTISVTLIVSASPVLTANPPTLSFNYTPGGTVPLTQSVQIAVGTAAIGISAGVTSGSNWLSVSPTSATTPTPLTVSVDPTGLAPGIYSGTIGVAAFSVPNSPLSVPVTLIVSEATVLKVSPSSLTFSYQINGPTPLGQAITLSNAGPALSFSVASSVTSGGNWLTASSPGATTPAFINVSVNPTGLAEGTYTGKVTITAPSAPNSPLDVPVTLIVSTNPVVTLSPAALSFNFQVGGTAPPQRTVLVTNFGTSLSLSAAATSTGGWLAVSPTVATTPAALQVSVNPSSLAPGTYSGTVTVTVSGAANSPITLPVNLTVSATPLLNVTPDTLSFNYQVGGAVPAGRTVSVSSTGSALSFTASTSTATGSWLQLSSNSGTTPADLTVSVNPSGLVPGVYSGSISVVSTEAGSAPQIVAVTLTVSNSPLLNISPASLAFSFVTSGSFPANQPVTVSSTGVAFIYSVNVSTSTGGSWLIVSPTGASTGTAITVGANTTGLGAGTYTGVITISAPGVANSPQYVPVTFTVSVASNLIVGPGPLTFNQTVGGTAPASQKITVASGGTILSFTASVSILGGGNWLSISPSSGITPGEINVSVNATGLNEGTYTGSVIITAPGASNSPQSVPITLTVKRAATLSVSPTSLSFSFQMGGQTPSAQSVSVTSSGPGVTVNAAAQTTSGGNWLSVTPANAATPATFNVLASPTGLVAGNYSGTVTLSSADVTNSPRTVNVTLTVVAITPPSLTAFKNAASFLPTGVAPGLIVTLGGTGIGPATLTTLQLNSAGRVAARLADTRVLFDGVESPLIYVSDTQTSAVAPYVLAGRLTTRVQVEYKGVLSNPLDLPVVQSAPGLFTLNASGSGPGAILNQNSTVNTSANPAARGSIVVIYATGEGQTSPPGVDGEVAGAILREPLLPVSVRIGGQPADVLYAGAAPGFVSGVIQINARMSANVTPGNAVPVEVTIGSAVSQPGVTVAVR